MRVVDTSAWIAWLLGGNLGKSLASEMPSKERWLVPTIVQYELTLWSLRESSEAVANRAIAFSMECVIAPLDSRLALRAVEVAQQNGLAMADAIIYTTAIEAGADLLTCDAHFDGLASVAYFARGAE